MNLYVYRSASDCHDVVEALSVYCGVDSLDATVMQAYAEALELLERHYRHGASFRQIVEIVDLLNVSNVWLSRLGPVFELRGDKPVWLGVRGSRLRG